VAVLIIHHQIVALPPKEEAPSLSFSSLVSKIKMSEEAG
jgi:hypothetical protein